MSLLIVNLLKPFLELHTLWGPSSGKPQIKTDWLTLWDNSMTTYICAIPLKVTGLQQRKEILNCACQEPWQFALAADVPCCHASFKAGRGCEQTLAMDDFTQIVGDLSIQSPYILQNQGRDIFDLHHPVVYQHLEDARWILQSVLTYLLVRSPHRTGWTLCDEILD